jgi:hypothetical protein
MFKLIGEIESYRAGSTNGNPWAFLKIKGRHVNFGQLHANDYEIFCPEGWQSFDNMQYATIEVPIAISMDFKKNALKIVGLSGMGVEPRVLKAAPKTEQEFLEQARGHYRAAKEAEKEAEKGSEPVDSKKSPSKAA